MSTDKFTAFVQTFDKVLKNIRKIETSYMKDLGLRGVHINCLLSLDRSAEGLTVTEISKECGIDKALSSRMIRELLLHDFVVSSDESDDKKYNRKYILTEKSKKALVDLKTAISDCVDEAGENIPKQKLGIFYEVLFELGRNIESIAITKNSEDSGHIVSTDTANTL